MEIVMFWIVILSASSVLYVLFAFQTPAPALHTPELRAESDATAARAARTLSEIEFDYEAGKLSKIDFEEVRKKTVDELAAKLKSGGKSGGI